MPTLADRLEACFSGVIYDVMRELGLKARVLPRGIRGIEPTMKCAGPVFTVRGRPDPTLDKHGSLLAWTETLSKSKPGHVVVCQPQDDTRALMGELSAAALRIKGVRGYIVDGGCRDAQGIVDQSFPVFCKYYTPIDIVAAWRAEAYEADVVIGDVVVRSGDYVLADRDGIVLIGSDEIERVLTAAEAKMSTEGAMAKAILAGMDPKEAYLKYGVF